jgi:hypothetical protein
MAFDPPPARAECRISNCQRIVSGYRNDCATCWRWRERPQPRTPGRRDVPDVRNYRAFVDPASGSAGSGADSFTLAISHKDGDKLVIDKVVETRPSFSPVEVVAAYCEVLKSYRVTSVTGDRWAAGFAAEAFKQHGVRYKPSEKTKSQLYAEMLPLLNSGRVVLPRHERLLAQLVSLERRVGRGTGRDSIDAPVGCHDDVANAAAGACVAAKSGSYVSDLSWVSPYDDADASKRWQEQRFNQHVLYHSGFYGFRALRRF